MDRFCGPPCKSREKQVCAIQIFDIATGILLVKNNLEKWDELEETGLFSILFRFVVVVVAVVVNVAAAAAAVHVVSFCFCFDGWFVFVLSF